MKNHWLSHIWLVLLLALMSALVGCGGSNGNDGSSGKSAYEIAVDNGFTGTEQEWLMSELGVGPEQCVYCHNGEVARNGITHQKKYEELFQQDVITFEDIGPNPGQKVAYASVNGKDVVTFKLLKNGAAFDCTTLLKDNPDGSKNSLNIRFSEYDAATRRFSSIDTTTPPDGAIDLYSIIAGKNGTIEYDSGSNICTSTNPQGGFGDLSTRNGLIAVYGENEILEQPGHINLGRFPFAALLATGPDGVDYESEANATGCENCHTKPYYKHGYIRGDVSNGGGLDFYACKVCHVDNRNGGDQSWKFSVDQPQAWASAFLQAQESADPNDSATTYMTPDQKNQYAYKTRLMNDVHMSHSMEFPYPQPIRTCATCHEGKLDQVLSDENFTLETCLSCHPVTGGTDRCQPDSKDPGQCALDSKGNPSYTVDTTRMALKTYWDELGVLSNHVEADGSVTATPCNTCHKAIVKGGYAPVFSALHTGYDPLIYYKDTDGNYQHYRDAITASIDSVTLSDNVLDIRFSASTSAVGTAAGLSADKVVPTVQVSFYGYDTKDFILSNHTKNEAGQGDRMEFTLGSDDNALFTTVANTAPNWEVKLNLAAYKVDPADYDIVDAIAKGEVKKAEVIVRPALKNADGDTVGLNAVSKTVDVSADGTDQFVDNYFQGTNALVRVAKVDASTGNRGCNSCHDQLAITFHSGDRGGNIVVCRSCHVVTSGGSHLEGQSRSIDSYVHAIHRFQPFNIADPTDPVEVAKYDEHSEFLFPDFAAINCERCHEVDRVVDAESRKAFDIPDQSKSMPGLLSKSLVGGIPELVTGPAARACGGCHRAEFTKEGDTTGYVTFIEHTKRFGYAVENDDSDNMLYTIIRYIMGLFQ
jgi:hypothetical protein